MRFNFGTDILNWDGDKVGELHQIVMDPATDRVTALVARKGFLLPTDKVIPISLVMESSEDAIKLYDFEGDFEDLDDYIEFHYVSAGQGWESALVDEQGLAQAPIIAYPPYGKSGLEFRPVIIRRQLPKAEQVKNIPEENIDIPQDAKVIGFEGEHLGQVEEVIVHPHSDRVTHFVISKGVFFKEEKLIPVSWVGGFDSDVLKLSVNSKVIEQLPEHTTS